MYVQAQHSILAQVASHRMTMVIFFKSYFTLCHSQDLFLCMENPSDIPLTDIFACTKQFVITHHLVMFAFSGETVFVIFSELNKINHFISHLSFLCDLVNVMYHVNIVHLARRQIAVNYCAAFDWVILFICLRTRKTYYNSG